MKENESVNSELHQKLLVYPGVLPNALYHVYNPYVNSFELPRRICVLMQEKHGDNWLEHSRLEAFKKPNESFDECEDRLIEELLNEIDLPIFLKK